MATSEKLLALTLDDGPNPPFTEHFLRVLGRYGVPATFFFIGRNIEMHRATALKVVQSGNEIGNHSYSHERMRWRSFFSLDHEIARTDFLIRSLGYKGPVHFRAPFGEVSGSLGWWLFLRGRQAIGYSFAPNPPDYLRSNPREIAGQFIRESTPGSILLLHDGEGLRVESLEALNEMIPVLQSKGFTFVRLSELLARSKKGGRL